MSNRESLPPPLVSTTNIGILASGRFVISEMVADQGAPPWRWAAARNPGLTGLILVLLAWLSWRFVRALARASVDDAADFVFRIFRRQPFGPWMKS